MGTPTNTYSAVAVGSRLRAARECRGLTQAQLGDALGTGQAHISKVENGERGGSPRARLEAARYLGVDLSCEELLAT